MKKLFVVAALIIAAYCSKSIAQDVSGVFTSTEIVWFGVDFSNVKFVGNTADFANLSDIRDRQFSSINGLFISEPDKYNTKKAFKKDKVTNDLSVVEDRNKSLDINTVMAQTENTLSKETIEGMIKEYNPKEVTSGIGVCFIMENLIKSEKDPHATVYIVFFDIATKGVLICEKTSSVAGGFGFRNFWAKAVFNTLESISMKALEKKYKK